MYRRQSSAQHRRQSRQDLASVVAYSRKLEALNPESKELPVLHTLKVLPAIESISQQGRLSRVAQAIAETVKVVSSVIADTIHEGNQADHQLPILRQQDALAQQAWADRQAQSENANQPDRYVHINMSERWARQQS